MALVKITFDGSSVSASQDAVLNHFLCGEISAGILKGIGSELSYSVSNNYITFQDGYVQIYGRRIYVQPASQVYISLDSTKYGYVIIDVNLSTNNVSLTKVEASSTYPSLIQENLLNGGNRYQFPIAKYLKSTSSIELQSFDRTMIPTPLAQAQTGYNDAINFLKENYKLRVLGYPTSKSGSTYRYEVDFPITDCMLFVNVMDVVFLPLAGRFVTGHSNFGLYYRYVDNDHYIIGEWLPGRVLLLNTGSTSIEIKQLVILQLGD